MKFRLVTLTLAVMLSLLTANIHSARPQAPAPDSKFNVFVLGEVRAPGAYLLHIEMTMKELIALAGGMTDEAGAKFSLILREPPNGGRRQRITVDLNAVIEGTTPDIPIQDDDIILIPRDRTLLPCEPKPNETTPPKPNETK